MQILENELLYVKYLPTLRTSAYVDVALCVVQKTYMHEIWLHVTGSAKQDFVIPM